MDPIELVLQSPLPFALGFFFHAQPFLFLFQPGRIVPFPGDPKTPVKLKDPAGDIIQEIAIMRNRDDSALVVLQVVFQPGNRFRVEVVCRLIQKQDVWFCQKEPGQSDTPLFAARKHSHRRISGRAI